MTNDALLRILVLDHNRRNLALMTQFLQQQGYQVLPNLSLEEVDHTLNQLVTVSLALVDISGFDDRVWTLCQRLRKQAIPFLVISPRHHAAVQQASIVHGAVGLLGKPLVIREFSQLIRELLKGPE